MNEVHDYIVEHVSPRIAGRWDAQGAWCKSKEAQLDATRAFANHFFSRLRFVGLHVHVRSPNKNKYHSTAETYMIILRITSMTLTTLVV